MKRKRFVILDRDGTIIVEKKYLSDPAQVELVAQAASGLQKMQAMNLGLVVVTNQSGIGRGKFTTERLAAVHERMRQLLAQEQIELAGIYHCPHLPDEGCACRKPKPGLIKQAAQELGFDPTESFVIGDKTCDLEAGRRVGATTFLVRTGYGNETLTQTNFPPDYVADDLLSAAQVIQQLLRQQPLNLGAKHS